MAGFKHEFLNTKKEPMWGCFIGEETRLFGYLLKFQGSPWMQKMPNDLWMNTTIPQGFGEIYFSPSFYLLAVSFTEKNSCTFIIFFPIWHSLSGLHWAIVTSC